MAVLLRLVVSNAPCVGDSHADDGFSNSSPGCCAELFTYIHVPLHILNSVLRATSRSTPQKQNECTPWHPNYWWSFCLPIKSAPSSWSSVYNLLGILLRLLQKPSTFSSLYGFSSGLTCRHLPPELTVASCPFWQLSSLVRSCSSFTESAYRNESNHQKTKAEYAISLLTEKKNPHTLTQVLSEFLWAHLVLLCLTLIHQTIWTILQWLLPLHPSPSLSTVFFTLE